MPDVTFDPRLKRILECFFESRLMNGSAQIEEQDLYDLYKCLSNAANSTAECGEKTNI